MPGLAQPRFAGTRLDARTVRAYVDSGAWAPRPLGGYLRDAIAAAPDRLAAVTREEHGRTALTYHELGGLVDRVRTGLARLGVGAGDVVSVMLPNTHEFAALIWAIWELGAVYSGVSPSYGRREASFMLGRTKAKVLVVPDRYHGRHLAALAGELRGEADELRTVIVVGDAPEEPGWLSFDRLTSAPTDPATSEPDPSSLAHLGFTSGTTGEPKAVMNTHQTLDAVLGRWVSHVGRESLGDPVVNLVCSPVAHHTGFLWGVLLATYTAGTAVYQDRWDPAAAARVIREEEVTTMVAAPTFLQDLTRAPDIGPEGLPSLRLVAIPGAPIPRPLVPAARERLGCFVCPSWGMTEYGIGISARPGLPTDRVDAADGVPVGDCRVRVVDPVTRAPLPPGETGALEISGPGLFLGYLDRPDVTAEEIVDGWFRTGDLAAVAEDGYVTLQGRTKDIIIRGGLNIPVVAVENLLHRHPDVLDAAVVGTPDPRLGERACAVLVVAEGAAPSLRDVTDFLLAEGLSTHFLPERVELVDALPKTMSGKIRKVELRQRLSAPAVPDRMTDG
ncbi:MAG: AMP-binding protein [Streptosporangiaceae bacterium]